jgi:hypothetical protein
MTEQTLQNKTIVVRVADKNVRVCVMDGAVPLKTEHGKVVPVDEADIYVVVKSNGRTSVWNHADLLENLSTAVESHQLIWRP